MKEIYVSNSNDEIRESHLIFMARKEMYYRRPEPFIAQANPCADTGMVRAATQCQRAAAGMTPAYRGPSISTDRAASGLRWVTLA
ncbi:hypothetical protein ANAPRD1_01324 [Anaplasma phagocytophilum]|nr:hypothetical protein ANAPC5_01361 [Anaplasma phagocytophilum]SCV66807.1 hypothetical protein ANAPRD1_01324 [Anaplasma phagocytophilum]